MPDDVIEDISVDAETGNVTKTVHPPGSDIFKARKRARIENELRQLDSKISRENGNEEILRALKSVGATLSPFASEVLNQKDALREELATLND